MHENWDNSAINKGYIVYFSLRMRETAGRISTSDLKSRATIMFLDPDFL